MIATAPSGWRWRMARWKIWTSKPSSVNELETG